MRGRHRRDIAAEAPSATKMVSKRRQELVADLISTREDVKVGKRIPGLHELGPAALHFLVDSYRFDTPECGVSALGEGVTLVYRRPGLTVKVETWTWKNESGFDTTLTDTSVNDQTLSASLDRVFETCGLGSARDVPGGHSGGGHTTRKRIEQHATALRAVMPLLDGSNATQVIRRSRA